MYHGIFHIRTICEPVLFDSADVGTVIHRKTLEKCLFEKDVAIKAAEAAIWKQAEAQKEEALERAGRRAKLDQEKLVAKLNKAHERAIRVSTTLHMFG